MSFSARHGGIPFKLRHPNHSTQKEPGWLVRVNLIKLDEYALCIRAHFDRQTKIAPKDKLRLKERFQIDVRFRRLA